MSKVKSYGYTDTAIAGVTGLDFPRGLVNFDADFRVKSDKPGQEVVLTNTTSPIDRPEKLRIAYSDVANVYNGTGIDPSVSAPTKRGISILVQETSVLSVSDSVDADFRLDLPLSCHLVIKVPASEYVTADDVLASIGRLLSGLFDTGLETNARLNAILRGSLVPSDV